MAADCKLLMCQLLSRTAKIDRSDYWRKLFGMSNLTAHYWSFHREMCVALATKRTQQDPATSTSFFMFSFVIFCRPTSCMGTCTVVTWCYMTCIYDSYWVTQPLSLLAVHRQSRNAIVSQPSQHSCIRLSCTHSAQRSKCIVYGCVWVFFSLCTKTMLEQCSNCVRKTSRCSCWHWWTAGNPQCVVSAGDSCPAIGWMSRTLGR